MSSAECSLRVFLDGLSFDLFRAGELSSFFIARLGGEASLFELSCRLLGGDASLSCRRLGEASLSCRCLGGEASLFELS